MFLEDQEVVAGIAAGIYVLDQPGLSLCFFLAFFVILSLQPFPSF